MIIWISSFNLSQKGILRLWVPVMLKKLQLKNYLISLFPDLLKLPSTGNCVLFFNGLSEHDHEQ